MASTSTVGRTDQISIVRLPDHVESVHAIRAAVGEGDSGLRVLVFGEKREQMCHPAALHTRDGLGWVGHTEDLDLAPRRITAPITPEMADPMNIPTFDKSTIWGSVNASPAMKSDTVNPTPATADNPMM